MTERRDGISRRQALQRAALLAAGTGMPFSFAAASGNDETPWQELPVAPVQAPGYGTDPNLLHPAPVPWPATFSASQRQLAGVLADILMPAEDASPSATAVGVVAVLDEWVSAPYELQQAHRVTIVSGLSWCDAEAQRRFRQNFVQLASSEQLQIVDTIAYPDASASAALQSAQQFFDLLRRLVTGMYYTTPQGWVELGFQGNVPINGDYPGPTREALAHLQAQADKLGLKL